MKSTSLSPCEPWSILSNATPVTSASNSYEAQLRTHLEASWGPVRDTRRWTTPSATGEVVDLPVAVFGPRAKRRLWTYASLGVSVDLESPALELFVLSPVETDAHLELLGVIAHYHRHEARLDHGHTVNIGRPWLPGSICDHALISLPYLDGPAVELARIDGRAVRCLWLIPITPAEREYKKANGLEALELLFDDGKLDYANAGRSSLAP